MNKHLIKAAFAAALTVSATQPALAEKAAPAAAPAAAALPGIAYANPDALILASNAYKAAVTARPTTYKAQYDSLEARRLQIQAQLKPLVDKFNADRAAPNANQAVLQQQAQTIQQIQESAQDELQKILAPVAQSDAYVKEQIADKLQPAVAAAMAKRKVTLLLRQDAIIFEQNASYSLNQDILNELNAAIPSAQIVPPAGWEPRQVREAKAQQAAQAPAPAPAATGKQPAGR